MDYDNQRLIDPDRQRSNYGIQNASRDIIAVGLLTLIPMLVICGLLLGTTFGYILDQNGDWFRAVDFPDAKSDRASYYLSISATNYVTISSWASNIASSLTGFVMVLFSFLVAYRLSQSRSTGDYLLTPFQLNLFLQAKSGSLGSFWSLARYLKWRKREKIGGMVIDTYLMLTTVLFLRSVTFSATAKTNQCAQLLYMGS